jgi:hypothetical protein
MDDAARMGNRKPLRQSPRDIEATGHAQARSQQASSEVLAIQPFHRQIALPSGHRSVRDVTHDGRVPHLREDAGLLRKAHDVPSRVGHHLERDGFPGHAIQRLVHGAHPAAAGKALDHEAIGDDLSRHQPPGRKGVHVGDTRRLAQKQFRRSVVGARRIDRVVGVTGHGSPRIRGAAGRFVKED